MEVGVDVDVDVDVGVVVVGAVVGLVKFLLLKFVVHSSKSRRRTDTNIGVTPL